MKDQHFSKKSSRRSFLAKSITGVSAISIGTNVLANTSFWEEKGMPTRPLGKTGVDVSILGLGGWHIRSVKDNNEAFKIIDAAIGEGLTFLDNSWDYHKGAAEELIGDALQRNGLRKKAFVMTKFCDRDYKGAMQHLEDSLRRLKTDYLDLWQFHEFNYDNDPEWALEKGGLKAVMEAKKSGKVRFIGFTGHKDPRIHLKALELPMDWDTVQMPINIMDAHYRSFQNQVVPVCNEKNIGVIGMKSLGGSGAIIPTKADISVDMCIRYALNQPISTLVSGISSMTELKQNISSARNFSALSAAHKKELLAKVKDVAGDGRYEIFKSTTGFDGGHHRKQHGFTN